MPSFPPPPSASVKATLLLASSLTVMAGALVAPALPRISEVFADTPKVALLSKLIITLPALIIAISSPLVGYLVDRFGKLRLFAGSMLLYALAGSSAFWLSDLSYILLTRAFLGLAVAGIMTIATTLIGDYFSGVGRNKFLGSQAAFMALGGTLFVSISGLLADINWRFPFLVYLFSLVVLFMMRMYLHEPPRAQARAQASTDAAGRASPPPQLPMGIISLIYLATFIGMVVFYIVPVQSPFLFKALGIERSFWQGMGIIVTTIFAALISQNYGRLKQQLSFSYLYAASFGLVGLGYALIGWADHLALALLGYVFAGLGAGLYMPNANTWLLTLAPPQLRGRIMGGMTTSIFLGQFFSPIIFQPLVHASQSIQLAHLWVAASLGLLMLLFGGIHHLLPAHTR